MIVKNLLWYYSYPTDCIICEEMRQFCIIIFLGFVCWILLGFSFCVSALRVLTQPVIVTDISTPKAVFLGLNAVGCLSTQSDISPHSGDMAHAYNLLCNVVFSVYSTFNALILLCS